MTYTYKCDSCCGIHERFQKRMGPPEEVNCPVCGGLAKLTPSLPLGSLLLGDPAGYSKPSALKRHSYKTISAKGNS